MEALFNKRELDKALGAAIRATSSKGTISALSGILIEAKGNQATFSATNYDTSIQYKIPARTEVPGCSLVSGRLLHDLVMRMPGPDVTLAVSDKYLTVRSGAADYKIVSMDSAEFPAIEAAQTDNTLNISADDLRNIHRFTAFAVATDKGQRPIFTGINLTCKDGALVAVGTDTHQLAKKSIPFAIDAQSSIVVPPLAIAEVIKLTDPDEGIALSWGKGKVIFQTDNLYFSCRAIDGVFPDVERVIPKVLPTRITLCRKDLELAIDRLSLVAIERYKGGSSVVICLALQDNVLTITGNGVDKGEAKEVIAGVSEGPAVSLKFKGDLMLDCLRALDTDRIILSLPDKPGGATIVGEGDDSFIYVIMSLRN